MKRGSTLLLKSAILFIFFLVAFWLIAFPNLEGRATNLDLVSIYSDPFIIFIYIGSIPFFILLYQVFKLISYIEQNKKHSELSIKAIRNIKYCGLSLIGFILIAILYIRVFVKGDDPAGSTSLGIFTILIFTVVAISTAVYEKRLQKTIGKKPK